jgi:hypothetical protein
MNVSTIVVAALPFPVTRLHWVPTIPDQTKELAVYTPLFCFLTLSFLFYNRHAFGRWMFASYFNRLKWLTYDEDRQPSRIRSRLKEIILTLVPLVFIALSFACIIIYRYAGTVTNFSAEGVPVTTQIIMMALYIGTFVSAEVAFVLMAIKEYLQDYLQLEDGDVIGEGGVGHGG